MRPGIAEARRRAAAGLTLLELLVAMTLLGLIVVFAAGGVRMSARVWEAARVGDPAGDLALVEGHLRRWIEGAQPLALGAEDAPIAFLGAPDNLKLLVSEVGRGDRPGVLAYQIGVERGAGLVLRRRRPQPDDASPFDPTAPSWLLSDQVIGVSFRYRGAADPPEDWRDDWSDAAQLPGVVRVRLRLRSGPEAERVLVIRPRLSERF